MFFIHPFKKWASAFLTVLFLIISLAYPLSSAAQITAPYSYSGIKPFGGRIISMQPCQSPPGMMLNIGPPRGGQFLLTDSSQVFNYGVFTPGVWTLGTAEVSSVTCRGKSGLFSSGIAFLGASAALTGVEIFQGGLGAIGTGQFLIPGTDFILPFSYVRIGLIAAFIASRFIFGKKLDTIGHPHVIRMIGTSLTP
jgi:hypothetical protein